MAEAAKAAARSPAFRLGRKEIFLPSHVVTFVRKTHLPPNEACFNVPLQWNKFDLRDYLWNLYGVEVTKVRSYVKEQPLTQRVGLPNSWYRPQAKKFMTVELAQPFQWPEVPENTQPWNKEMWDMREERLQEQRKEQSQTHRGQIPLPSEQKESEDRKQLRSLAQKMLSGEVKWENNVKLDPKWEHIMGRVDGAKDEVKTEEAVEPEVSESKDDTARR